MQKRKLRIKRKIANQIQMDVSDINPVHSQACTCLVSDAPTFNNTPDAVTKSVSRMRTNQGLAHQRNARGITRYYGCESISAKRHRISPERVASRCRESRH